MKRIIGISVVLVFLLSSFACGIVWAQSTAQISGTVKDQSGAVLPWSSGDRDANGHWSRTQHSDE